MGGLPLAEISKIGTDGGSGLYADITFDGNLAFEFEIYLNEKFDFDYVLKTWAIRKSSPSSCEIQIKAGAIHPFGHPADHR